MTTKTRFQQRLGKRLKQEQERVVSLEQAVQNAERLKLNGECFAARRSLALARKEFPR